MKPSIRYLLSAAVTGVWAVAWLPTHAATEVPSADLTDLADPPGIKRYAGSVLVYRDDAAYDEMKFPSGKVRDVAEPYSALVRSGARVALQYTLPAGRSSLEVIRNYQQQARGDGFQAVFECMGDTCGAGNGQLKYSIVTAMLPPRFFDQVSESSVAACGAYGVASIRYALLENKSTGVTLAVAAANPEIFSVYCDDAFKNQLTVWVSRVEPQVRAQQMVALSASDMAKSIDADGRVALYGIYFDSGSGVVRGGKGLGYLVGTPVLSVIWRLRVGSTRTWSDGKHAALLAQTRALP